MRYEGDIYRPPSEARSLIVQVTVGCAHNRCTFCSMYKNKKFHLRPISEVLEDLDEARKYVPHIEKIFLADGDALCLTNDKLLRVLDHIARVFPECQRVGIYGSAKDVLRKTPEELSELREHGLGIVYLGAESGSDRVLEEIHKGVNARQLIEAVQKAETVGIPTSVTFISGLAGKEGWQEHAVETGRAISEMEASYVSLLTLMVEPSAPLYQDIRSGKFRMLSPYEVMLETELLLRNTDVKKGPTVFRSNHASNYLSLRGDLPRDKERMLTLIARAKDNQGMLKDERFRML